MASVCHDTTRNGYRIQYWANDRRKRSIWLGQVSQKSANEFAVNVEDLKDAAKLGIRPPANTVKWVLEMDSRLRKLLVDHGLVAGELLETISNQSKTVREFFDGYIAEKQNVSERWTTNYKQAVSWFFQYFPEGQLLTKLMHTECQRWDEWMVGKLAVTTRGQHVKRCRQMLKAAVSKGIIGHNPLSGVKASSQQDEDKNLIISPEDTEKIIAASSDPEFRLLIAMARYSGIRVPSEVAKLKWSDIRWDKNRIRIHAPKTTRYGKSIRWVPIIGDLRHHLQAFYDLKAPGVECPEDSLVFSARRRTDKNNRTHLARIISRLGLPLLPKPFVNFRASARYDLEQSMQFTQDELNAWFGHTGEVARKHYGRLGEASFEKASQIAHIDRSGDSGSSQEASAVCGSARGSIPARQGASADIKNPGKQRVPCFEGTQEYTQEDSNL